MFLSWCMQEDSDSLVLFFVASRLLPGGILCNFASCVVRVGYVLGSRPPQKFLRRFESVHFRRNPSFLSTQKEKSEEPCRLRAALARRARKGKGGKTQPPASEFKTAGCLAVLELCGVNPIPINRLMGPRARMRTRVVRFWFPVSYTIIRGPPREPRGYLATFPMQV